MNMRENKLSAEGGLNKNRVETLVDGVFAIVMTLLVFDIRVPTIAPEEAARELPRQLIAMYPRFLAYVFSFVILGFYWVGHRAQMHYIRRTDRLLLWINILFLMSVGAQRVQSEYDDYGLIEKSANSLGQKVRRFIVERKVAGLSER